jgi:hypothetical protein
MGGKKGRPSGFVGSYTKRGSLQGKEDKKLTSSDYNYAIKPKFLTQEFITRHREAGYGF